MVHDAALFNTQNDKERIKGEVEQSREKEALSAIPQCINYWKGSLRVALDYGGQLY